MKVPCSASGRAVWPAVLAALVCGLSSHIAFAQTHPGSVPLGGRSTLMGGTGVALGRDGASPFLNPATMGRIGDTRLAFSVRFYRYAKTRVERLVRIPADEKALHVEDYEEQGISGAPSSFCAFVTLTGLIPEEAEGLLRVVRGGSGRTKLGLCGASIEREALVLSTQHHRIETGEGVTAANLDLERVWSRSVFGPSASYQVSDTLTLGASMHLVSSSARDRYSLAALSDSRAYQRQPGTFLHESHASSRDGMTTLGVTYVWRSLTTGLSLRFPSIHFVDSAKMTSFEQVGTDAPSLRAGSGRFKAPLPMVMTLGTGLDWPHGSLEFDVAATLGGPLEFETHVDERSYSTDGLTPQKRSVRSRVRGRSGVAFRTGGEWALSPSLSLLAGARYEPSRVSSSIEAQGVAPSDGCLLGSSFGIGSYGSGVELLFGTELSYGWSRFPIPDPRIEGFGRTMTEQHSWSALLVLSGSVGLSSVKRTWRSIEELRQRREPDPRPPAE